MNTFVVGTLLLGTLSVGNALASAPSSSPSSSPSPSPSSDPSSDAVYVARLQAVNVKASGQPGSGEMQFTIHGDTLTIKVHVQGVPPSIEHWQHFHGFNDGKQAACPAAAADVNGDGYIDIRETEPAAGTTMVPFNADPVGMDIPTHTYPHASATGTYDYEKTVSVAALQKAFGAKFGEKLDLARRVVQVHGVPETTSLPASVASLGTIPARVTIPLACGVITRVK
jgi:hypothetical protein